MTEYKTENKLGVGEILICSKDTNGKLEPLKSFIGKVIINVCGGGEKIYVIEEKDKILSEVKSIQSRSNFKELTNNAVEAYYRSSQNSIVLPSSSNGNLNNPYENEEIERKTSDSIKRQMTLSRKNNDENMATGQGNMGSRISQNLHDINELDEMKENNEDFNMDKGNEFNDRQISDPKRQSMVTETNRRSVVEEKNITENRRSVMEENNNMTGNRRSVIDENYSTGNNFRNSQISVKKDDMEMTNQRLSKKMTNNNFQNEEGQFIAMDDPDVFPGISAMAPLGDLDSLNYIPPIENKLENKRNSRISNTQLKNENSNQSLKMKSDIIKENQSLISNNSNYDNDFVSGGSPKIIGFTDKESQIIQIVKGKYHLLKLTMDGRVYGSGISYFGVVGLGGSCSSDKPVLIPNLTNIKIVQIACGMFHSLALSLSGDLYAWGMGFEGQLGITGKYKVASSPRYLNFFYRKPVKFIACGHNYSLCITNDSRLWGWGENKLGQLGLGKIQIVEKPTHIELFDLPSNQEGCNQTESYISGVYERPYSGKPLSACYVSAGYAHTAIVTDEGFLLTCGLNIYGQLGLGNTTSTFEPKLIEKDINGDYMGKVLKVSCSVNGSFIITEEGKLYSCGSGEIGHGEIGVIKLPKQISDSRIYHHIFCNDNSVVAFCPLRIISVSPTCGPASGNTILSIIGSALKDFPKLSVRFIFGGVARVSISNFY
jgi:alpha-tubulin suppressor-like RCC1 family protein